MKYMDIKKYIKNIYNGFYEIFIEGNDKKHLQKFIDEKLINYRIHSNQQVGGQAFNKSEYCFDEQYHYFIKKLISSFKKERLYLITSRKTSK